MKIQHALIGLSFGAALLVSCGDGESSTGTPDNNDTTSTPVDTVALTPLPFDWEEVANAKHGLLVGLEVKKEPMYVVVMGNLRAMEDLVFEFNEILYSLENYDELSSQVLSLPEGSSRQALAFKNAAESNGFRILSAEGQIFFTLSGDFIKEDIEQFCDTLSWEFLNLYTLENDRPCCEDGGMVISTEDLMKRVSGWGNLIDRAAGTEYEDIVKASYESNLDLLFFGLNNTPAFDYDTNKYKEEYFNEMSEFVANNPDHRASQDFAPFIELLEDSNMEIPEEVRAALLNRD